MENKMLKIYDDGKLGEVRIDTQIIAIIAGLAVTEVDGVESLYGNVTNEIIAKFGVKSLSKGVKITADEENVAVEVAVCLEYGKNIMEVSEDIQEKVKNAVENMTGINVSEVNVRIANINMDND